MDKIPLEVRSLIRSSINIRSYVDAISELIYNSLDADATSIAVRVDLVKHKIQVIDNGQGIKMDDMQEVGRKHMTSKCRTLHDLKHNVKTFGFRGEAISSIVNISEKVVVDSLYFKGDKTYSKSFYKGIEDGAISEIKMRPSHGTTVTITNFLFNLGVRQRSIDPVLEMEEIRICISKIALLHYYVSFTLRDDQDGKLVLKTHKSCSVREASGYLFDQSIGGTLIPITVDSNRYSIEGYISKDTHINKTFQYVYVNKRYIKNCDVKKLCSDLLCEKYGLHLTLHEEIDKKNRWPNFTRNFKEKKYPVFIINLMCPQSDYDITCMPDKSIIQFKHGDRVRDIVKMFVNEYVRKMRGDRNESDNVAVKINDNKEAKKRKMKEKMEKLEKAVKGIMDKNVEEFGASQMHNAVKGIPAKRRPKLKTIIEHSPYPRNEDPKCTAIEESIDCVATPKQKSQIAGMNIRHKIKRKIVGQIGNKSKPKLDIGSRSSHVKKMRETPFILSQMCKAKTVVKSKDLNGHKAMKILQKDVAVNVNILSRKVHHVKTRIKNNNCYSSLYRNEQILVSKSKGNRNYYQKTTQSSVVHHINFDSHKNFNLANQEGYKFDDGINNQRIPRNNFMIGDDNFNEMIHGSGTDQYSNQFLTKNDLKDIFNMFKNELFVRQESNGFLEKRSCIQNVERPIKKTCDMIRTIIPEKRLAKSVVNDVEFGARNDIFDVEKQFKMPDKIMYTNAVRCSKQLKNSAAQTILNLDDIEAMMRKCEKIRRNAVVADNSTKDVCLYHSVPNMRLHWARIPSVEATDKQRLDDGGSAIGEKADDIVLCDSSVSSDHPRNIDITSFTCVNNDVSVHFRTSGSSERDDNNRNVDLNDFLEIVQIDGKKINANETIDLTNEIESIRRKSCEIDVCEEVNAAENDPKDKMTGAECNLEIIERKRTKKDNRVDKIDDGIKEIVVDETIQDHSSDDCSIVDENGGIMLDKINNLLDAIGDPANQFVNLCSVDHYNSTKSASKSLSMFKSTSDLDVEFVEDESNNVHDKTRDKSEQETRSDDVRDGREDVDGNKERMDEYVDDGVKKNIEMQTLKNKEDVNAEKLAVEENTNAKVVCVTSDDSGEKSSPANEANEWELKTDSLGKVYYINNRTGMTLYENPLCGSTSIAYKVHKRPGFVPKGLSPILKLGQANWEFGNRANEDEILSKAKNNEAEILAKIKHGNLYYTDEAYENFASGLRKSNFSEFLAADNVGKLGSIQNSNNCKRFKPNDCFRFNKEMLQDVEVVNQVDKKFICATVEDNVRRKRYILLFDQHAVHERIQLEKLISEYKSDAKWKSTNVQNPIRVSVNAHDLPLLKKYRQGFESIGLTYTWRTTDRSEIDITGLPTCFQYTDINEDDTLLKLVTSMICEELDVMKHTKGSCSTIPAAIMKVISSKACHSAIKFGASLSRQQCVQLLNDLSKCDVPFQCAHGRPSLTILLAEDINQRHRKQVKKLNFKNIKKELKKL